MSALVIFFIELELCEIMRGNVRLYLSVWIEQQNTQ
jgi:hypothetical protein